MRAELIRVAAALTPRAPAARWVPEENLHVTLAFIGAVEDDAPYRTAVRSIDSPAGVARIAEAGAFPSARRARVLWVGLADDGSIAAAAAEAARCLAPLGFEPEARPFRPHVTIARLKVPARVELAGVTPVSLPVPVADVTLYQSRLGRPAPRYEPLERVPLAGS